MSPHSRSWGGHDRLSLRTGRALALALPPTPTETSTSTSRWRSIVDGVGRRLVRPHACLGIVRRRAPTGNARQTAASRSIASACPLQAR